jgi:hypothetical protein
MAKAKPKFCIRQKLNDDWMRRDLRNILIRQDVLITVDIPFLMPSFSQS